MIDVILLISGNSKRMQKEKALLPFSKQRSFLCQLLDTYLNLQNAEIFVVVNESNEDIIKNSCLEFKDKISFLVNPNPEKGRLSSILLGLKHLKMDRGVFIQNIDNPFTSVSLLQEMTKNYQSDSFLVPQYKGKNGHPLLLGSRLVDEMKKGADAISDLKRFLNTKEKRCLITDEKAILANINSPEEYKKWFSELLN